MAEMSYFQRAHADAESRRPAPAAVQPQSVESSGEPPPFPRFEPLFLMVLTLLLLGLSGYAPNDRLTWWMEVAPILILLPVLIVTFWHFRLAPLTYKLLFVHGLIMMLGAHYTYAEVPLGEWARETFDLARNHYDRLGHVAQGFIPAILFREVLIRKSPLHSSAWLPPVVVAFCLAFSAFYELIEWWAAIIYGGEATAFLATQGDVWDTQWDMFLALCGAVLSLLLLSGLHNRQLRRLYHWMVIERGAD